VNGKAREGALGYIGGGSQKKRKMEKWLVPVIQRDKSSQYPLGMG